MSLKNLKLRIKKNEGYSKIPYKDQLGFYTIGYGHLIKNNENKYFKNKYEKKHFEYLFENDLNNAIKDYKKNFYKKAHDLKVKELLIEMIFQLGSQGVLRFKKMLFYLNKKQNHMVCLEMMDSLWYKQTPQRVKNLIKNFID